jgi:hypothetical protein
MKSFDPERDGRKEGMRRSQRKNAAKLLGARGIVRRTEWLSYTPVYWCGAGRPEVYVEGVTYRPITAVLAESLAKLEPGLYAVKIERPSISPRPTRWHRNVGPYVNYRVADAVHVTGRRIATTAYAIPTARKYPRALPKLVGDVDGWFEHTGLSLERIRSVLAGASALAEGDPRSLALEAGSLWVGPDSERPSTNLKTEAIRGLLAHTASVPADLKRVAAVLLGQRHSGRGLPGTLMPYVLLGETLSHWPLDWLSYCLGDRQESVGLQSLVRGWPRGNAEDVALAALEYRLMNDRGPIAGLVGEIPGLLAALDTALAERDRRTGLIVKLIDRVNSIVPAYVRDDKGHAAPGAAEEVWRRNPDFDGALCRELLKSTGAVDLDKSWVERHGGIVGLYGWYMGEDPGRDNVHPDVLRGQNGISEVRGALAGRAFEVLAGHPAIDRRPLELTICGLSGRTAGAAGRLSAIRDVASWIHACGQQCAPGRSGEEAVRLSIQTLEIGLSFSGWWGPNVSGLVDILARHGPALLSPACRRWHNRPVWPLRETYLSYFRSAPELWVAGHSGALTPAQCDLIFELDLLESAMAIIHRKRSLLPSFIDFIDVRRADWLHMDTSQREAWTTAFLTIPPGVYERILAWRDRIIAEGLFPRPDADYFLRSLFWFFMDYFDERERRKRIQFAVSNMWVFDLVAGDVRKYLDGLPWDCPTSLLDPAAACDRREAIPEIAFRWSELGFANVRELVERLLGACAADEQAEIAAGKQELTILLSQNDATLRTLMGISAGHAERFINLLRHKGLGWLYPGTVSRGWEFLRHRPEIRDFLSECAARPGLGGRLLKLIERADLASRLNPPHYFEQGFAEWCAPRLKGSLPELPLSRDVTDSLRMLRAYRDLAGHGTPWPKPIKKIIFFPQSLERERGLLANLERTGTLTGRQAVRLTRVRVHLADSAGMGDWMGRSLRSAVPEHLEIAKLEALEAIIARAIDSYRRSVIGNVAFPSSDDDWDNALLLYSVTEANRRLLKTLLRQEARGNRRWVEKHPGNLAFRAKMEAAGIDMAAWSGRWELMCQANGNTLIAHAETEPLKILQMGNIFGTCLSVGDVNAYSAIANAVECNKRVLFMKGHAARVIGRKLIALTRQGAIVGFRSYGSTEGNENVRGNPWIKILFDMFCLMLIRHSGAHFPTEEELKAIEAKPLEKLGLFAKWYYDGYERFDPWVTDQAVDLADLRPKDPAPVISYILDNLTGLDFSTRMAPAEAALRALIWLGDDALPAGQEVLERVRSEARALALVAGHAYGDELRSEARRLLDHLEQHS